MKVIETIPKVVTKAKTVYKMSQDDVKFAILLWAGLEAGDSDAVLDVTFEVHHDGYVITPADLNAIVTVEDEE